MNFVFIFIFLNFWSFYKSKLHHSFFHYYYYYMWPFFNILFFPLFFNFVSRSVRIFLSELNTSAWSGRFIFQAAMHLFFYLIHVTAMLAIVSGDLSFLLSSVFSKTFFSMHILSKQHLLPAPPPSSCRGLVKMSKCIYNSQNFVT
jgi:hypothetical protein